MSLSYFLLSSTFAKKVMNPMEKKKQEIMNQTRKSLYINIVLTIISVLVTIIHISVFLFNELI